MFDWTDARIFLVVCGKGSFTAAAQELSMDQTTVGRRIAALEAALNTKLFSRGPAGLTLTGAGEEARALAEHIETAAAALERRIRGRDSATEGTVRLTTIETFARAFIAPRLPKFFNKYPGIQVCVKTDARALSLTKREADIAIRHWRPTQLGLVARKLGEVAFAIYGAPSYAKAHEAKQRFLGFEDELAAQPDGEWLAERAGQPSPLTSNSRAVLEAASAAGIGAAILPCYLGDGRTDLVRLTPPDDGLRRDIWLVSHDEAKTQARIRAVIDFVAHEVESARDVLLGIGAVHGGHATNGIPGGRSDV
jgi:DNA-binding transcriptional LysR family regulator